MAENRQNHEPHEELEHLDKFDAGKLQRDYWEQQKYDTNYSYGAFLRFLHLGAGRRLKEAAKRFYYGDEHGRYPADTKLKPSQLWQFKEWSRHNWWVSRAEAWDAEQAAIWQAQLDENSRRMSESHLVVAKNAVLAANMKVKKFVNGEEEIPASQLAAILTAATNLQRITLGHATSRTEDVSKVQQPDYSNLTYEELVLLDEIGKKLYGGG